MPLKAWARTDTGHVRTNNEDSYLVDITHGVFVVADGVGGLEGGEVASGAVVDQIGRLSNALHQTVLAQASLNDMEHRQTIVNHLVECLHITNTYIYEQGLDPRYQKGIATTAELLLVSNEAAYVAHVGDSRIYLLRNGEIFRITQDHTLAEQLKEGYPGRRGLTELIKRHTHVLTRSLGTRPHVEIDTLYVDLFAGDRFLMCSDGLTDYLSGAEILKRADGEDPQAFVDGLVDEAKARGGKDNITVVLVEIPPEDMLVDRTPTRPDVMHGARFLKDIELFEDLPLPQLLKLMRIATSRTYKLGDYIVQQGLEVDGLYIVTEGEVSVRIGDKELARVQRGQHFGELALFGDPWRTADVRALGPTELLFMPAEHFRRLLGEDILLGNHLLSRLLTRASQNMQVLLGQLI